MTANWFGNSMWVSPGSGTDAASMHAMFSAGLYEREQEEQRRKAEEEQAQLELLQEQQARTRCFDSEDCASGFACVGGRCEYVDPTGATGDGGTAGCGAGPGGSGGAGGGGTGGSGCGGPAASSGGSSSVTLAVCNTSGAGSCRSSRGSQSPGSGGGGGGGGSCGDTCCRCGTSGCACFAGECPPPPERCSRFCTEASGLGSRVMNCGPKDCGQCNYCDDSSGLAVCKQDSPGADCRCGYECPGCMQCSFSGNCLIKNCPPPATPPGGGDGDGGGGCEPECRDTEVCVTNSTTGAVTCNTVQQCADLPPDCEPCDCNCSDECPECQTCNSNGKCVRNPECDDIPPCCSKEQEEAGYYCVDYCYEFLCYTKEDGTESCPRKYNTNCSGYTGGGLDESGFLIYYYTTECGVGTFALVSRDLNWYQRRSFGPKQTCGFCRRD